jgi:hypothetical protein
MHATDGVGVNLAQRDRAHSVRTDRMKEFLTIFEHAGAGIPVGKAEVQHTIISCGRAIA